MWIVTEGDVGRAAWLRMRTDGTLTPLTRYVATPADVPVTPPIRLAVALSHVRARGYISGVAALWVHAGGPAPGVIDLCSATRRHDRQGSVQWPVRVHHSGRPHADDARVASVGRAIVDALRWAPLAEAIPAVARAVRMRPEAWEEASRELGLLYTRDPTFMRATRAWTMLRDHGIGGSRPPSRDEYGTLPEHRPCP